MKAILNGQLVDITFPDGKETSQERELTTLSDNIYTRVSLESPAGVFSNWKVRSKIFATWLISKIANAQPPASLQLQSDWNVANTNSVQYIRNKPTIPTGSCVLIATASSVDFGTAGQTTMTWESGFSLDNTFMVEAIITYVSGTIAGTANVNLLLNAVYAGTFAPDATLAAGFKFYQNIEGGSTGDVTADLILDVTVPYVNPASLVDVKIYGVKYS